MSTRAHDPMAAQHKWVALKPTRHVGSRLVICLGTAVLWAILVPAVVQWFLPAGPGGRVAFYALWALALVPLGWAAYLLLVYRNLDDAKVSVDRKELVLGDQVHVRVEQNARRGLVIHEMRVGLCCQEVVRGNNGKSDLREVPLLEKWETLTRDKKIEHAKRMSGTRTFVIPEEKPASTPATQTTPPFVRWKIRVVTTPAHSPSYEAEYPIDVRAYPSATSVEDDWAPPGRRRGRGRGG